MRMQRLAILTAIGVWIPSGGAAQNETAEVRAAVMAHYAAINDGDLRAVIDQHAGAFTGFLGDNGTLVAFESYADQVAAWVDDPNMSMSAVWTVRDLDVRVLGDVAVATFYMDGTMTVNDETTEGPWRVTEVWVKEGDRWLELHHHDGPLNTGG